MAVLWRDIERDLASSHRHFSLAVDVFDELRGASSDSGQSIATMGFLHAVQSGYTSLEAGMNRLLALLDELLPAGADWPKTLLLRLVEAAPGSRPALVEEPTL